MSRRIPLLVILGLAAVPAACDRSATSVDDVAALVSAADPILGNSPALNSTLPALFRESIARVDRVSGRRGVDALLGDWRALQDQLKDQAPTASRAAIEAKLAAIHNEELRIVERVLGARAITKLIGDTNVGVAEARAHIIAAEAAGVDMTSARSVAQQIDTKLRVAREALAQSKSRGALDAATTASATLAGLRYFLVEGRRIAGLEGLLPQAVAKLKAAGDQQTLDRLELLKRQTSEALRSSDRSVSQLRLDELRSENIKLVLRVLGSESTTHLLAQVDERAQEVLATVAALKAQGRDVTKLERMTREALDLGSRASAALDKGDAVTALDLGSHAAGILNAVQHQTWN